MKGKVKLQHSEDYYVKVLLKETKIKEMMTTSVVSIDMDASFSEVPRIFKKHNIRHLPVVDKKLRLVGLISQRDVFKISPPQKRMDGSWHYDDAILNNIILKHVMKDKPFIMNEMDPLGEALVQIVEKKIGCIPIVDKDKKIVGIVTQIDILKVAAQIYQE